MARMSQNSAAQTFSPTLVDRIAAGVRYVLTGQQPAWFGPLDPMTPVAPEDVAGRQLDYPVGYNLRIRPRDGEHVTFEQLRALADTHEITRLCIETCKDQLVKLNHAWQITDKDREPTAQETARIKELTEWLKSPDKRNTWQQWYRMILEEMFVIDAVSVYHRRTVGGGHFGAEVIDGSTIKVLIDDTGRMPLTGPAYQQILKGLPAVDYTPDELTYFPRNMRVHKFYGFSPVEQMILLINTAIRRNVSQLQYYTDGNIPDAFGFLPPEWTPEQISQFQRYWDSIHEGNTAERRHLRFLPGGQGARVDQVRDPKLKDEFDEWIARVACYCFSLPPLPFVKQQNRATADTQQEVAKEEGLLPRMLWTADLMNRLKERCFPGYEGIEFTWVEEDSTDIQVQSTIIDQKLRSGRITLNEARQMDGLEPVDGGNVHLIYTASGATRLDDVLTPPEPVVPPQQVPGSPAPMPAKDDKTEPAPAEEPQKKEPDEEKAAEKLAKGKIKKLKRLNPNRRSAVAATLKVKKAWSKWFRGAAPDLAAQITAGIEKIKKADVFDIQTILDELEMNGMTVLLNPTQDAIEAVYKEAALNGISNLSSMSLPLALDTANLTTLVSDYAVKYASERAAELVGMKLVDGQLVVNPNPAYAISDSTRDALKSYIEKAIDEGWSTKHLERELLDGFAFSEERAEMIARTEINLAQSRGEFAGYKGSGIPMVKAWVTSGDHDQDDECDENADAGWIDMEEAFPSGDDATPSHPNCNCATDYQVKEEGEEE